MSSETSGKYDFRNAVINIVEGGLWVAGATLISSQTVLPALVVRLGGGNVAVGALGVVTWLGFFLPQVFASRYGQTLERKKPWVVRFGFLQRFVLLLLGAVILFVGGDFPSVALVLFFVLYSANQLITGVTSPVWYDFYAKLTPLSRRGRTTGIRSSVAGGVSIFGGLLLTWLLGMFFFPTNYAIVFFIAFILQLGSVVLQTKLVEEFPSRIMPRQSLDAYADQLREVLRRDVYFRKFLGAAMFLILAATSMGFFTVYVLNRFHAPETLVGEFTVTMVVGQIVGALLTGFLADRFGNQRALVSAASAMLFANIAAFIVPSVGWFRVVFFFTGMNLGSELMIRYNLTAEFSSVEQRSTYIGLMNTMLAPLYCFGILAGWISDAFGYQTLFAISMLFSCVGIALLLTRVHEPRLLNRPDTVSVDQRV